MPNILALNGKQSYTPVRVQYAASMWVRNSSGIVSGLCRPRPIINGAITGHGKGGYCPSVSV